MSVPEGHGKTGRAQPGRRQGATHSRSASRPIAPALEVAAAGEAAALSPVKRPRSQHGANSGPESRPEPTAQAHGCSRAVPLGRRAPRGRVVPQLPRQGLQGQGAAARGRRGQTRTHIRASEDPPLPHPPLPLPKRAEHGAVGGGGACPQPAPAASPLFPDGAIANSGTRWLPSYFFLLSSSFLSFNFYCNTKATIKKAKPNRQS